MELIITPECLSREELTHELSVRGTKVTDADGVDKLVHNLKYYLALESSGVLFETGPRLDPKYEMKRCSEILTEIQELLARVLDEANNSTIATKIAHLRKRLSRFAAEPGPQVEAKGELTADLNRAIDSFTTRVKFLAETPELSMRSGPLEFGAASSPRRTERVVERLVADLIPYFCTRSSRRPRDEEDLPPCCRSVREIESVFDKVDSF
jgi:hypothetical protein